VLFAINRHHLLSTTEVGRDDTGKAFAGFDFDSHRHLLIRFPARNAPPFRRRVAIRNVGPDVFPSARQERSLGTIASQEPGARRPEAHVAPKLRGAPRDKGDWLIEIIERQGVAQAFEEVLARRWGIERTFA
jgi:hypothetical protein